MIDPDLDHEQLRTWTELRIYRYLGVWPGRVWQAIWAPYGVLIPHRSALSHLPGLGTAIRAAYLFAVAWTVGHVIGHPIPLPSGEIIRWVLGAWAVQDTIHLALDGWRVKW